MARACAQANFDDTARGHEQFEPRLRATTLKTCKQIA
jgi:hypothetical protein